MAARFVCCTSAWRAGKLSSRVCVVSAAADAPPGACVHALPPSAQPVSEASRRKVRQNHERALPPGARTCAQDARAPPPRLPVLLQSAVLPEAQGCWSRVSAHELQRRLAAAAGGEWQLLAADGSLLRPSRRPLCECLPATPPALRLCARRVDGDRRQRLRERLDKVRGLTERAGTAGEHTNAARAAKRLHVTLDLP